MDLPGNLSAPHLLPLQPYATHLLQDLLSAQVFHILPNASLRAQNPSDIPRERFVADGTETPTGSGTKKKGRPSKRDKARKAKDAVVALDKWLDKNTLMAIGNLTVSGNEVAVATYSAKDKSWTAFDGASTSSIPGFVTAFSPASGDVSTFWLAGQSDDGTNYVVNYDGSAFLDRQEIFDDGTVIRGLDVLP